MTEACALTLNAGSSSIKFGLFDIAGAAPAPLMTGLVENIGGAARMKAEFGAEKRAQELSGAADHPGALGEILSLVRTEFPQARIEAVGHRVVHGGPAHGEPALLTATLLAELAKLEPFAPLHQPHNLAGVRAAMAAFPDAAQIACFDTAFHRNHPWVNDVFALPREFYDKGVRRYGFHGLSYDYVSGELARIAPHLHAGRVIVAHLGNGASMCALQGGRSVGSTMGFSALDGLPMGTRCGQLDPGVLLYLMEQEGMDARAISDLLYKRSGLLGLSGLSNDMRALEASDTPEAAQAIDYFVFRIRRELGALAAVLGGLDALVFCGGIGENARRIRERICEGMGWIGLEIDHAANAANATVISAELSRVRALVIPTDEEIVIARAAQRLSAGTRQAAE
ncbi:MAG: acetate/propionate family kinase [Rubrimonas sp.]